LIQIFYQPIKKWLLCKYNIKPMKIFIINILLLLTAASCNKSSASKANHTEAYSILGSKIYNFNNTIQFIGVNSFHVFGAGGIDMNSWKIDVAREFVGNVNEVHLSGAVFQDANLAYLYSLQSIVDSNRASKRITIICPFRWNGIDSTDFTGKRPTQTFWWNEFKTKLQQWATQFKDQPDVWLEVWNEPYRYDRADGYTDDIWMNDMNELVAIIRNADNNNIIVVPCAEQGQDESVLINKGAAFLASKNNILFDIHAYEKWLLVSNLAIGMRLQQLKQNNIPVIFGETAPLNAGVLMNPQSFLDSVYNRGLSVCAWTWKYDATDKDALLNSIGLPNDNNNNNWGTLYKTLCQKIRNP
jgi:mannan endo-1,4-beta-mannosidase